MVIINVDNKIKDYGVVYEFLNYVFAKGLREGMASPNMDQQHFLMLLAESRNLFFAVADEFIRSKLQNSTN